MNDHDPEILNEIPRTMSLGDKLSLLELLKQWKKERGL